MKIFVKLGLLLTLLWGSPLFAFTLCTTADWDEDICSLEKAGTRCSVDRAARVMVQNMCTAAACPPTIGGGCKGFLGSGKWFPVSIDAVSLRCQCGCSAEETEFVSEFGLITGTELLAFRDQDSAEDLKLLSQEDFGGGATGFYGIEDVIAGPEEKDVFTFISATGKSLTVTEGHPVAFAKGDRETKEEFMGPASQVPTGDHIYLINQDGSYDRIVSIDTHPYHGMTVNFTAMSPSRMVYTNGFKTGDNSWQQYLLMNDARVLTVGDIQEALANQQ
ncbi:hypothetical protein [Pseudobacteriovorax antillogorgiicola]|uniref:Intein N-terminal splicing region n=1 Tax=Pseudobacteriovorax antillogorgiicola TaxID=1513793 RepID=A0A1Y6BGC9_9BACT|nr:hypothetical protein [Pseudobacteriovorax antillogorgiicola]TCS56265.1 hypothetical protein EDD56_10487 [Pseudobacteriovorax antillogorgiicola]SMF07832.1 hypothetical protein SAMN06296036_104246 [Pseudobacteriovorax antillogorgiicola]